MRSLSRAGFTLVELLVGLALVGIVSAGVLRIVVGNQRLHQAQAQSIAARQSARAGAAILPAELRGLDAADGDIAAMSPTALTVRVSRQLAFLCARPRLGAGPSGLVVREQPLHGVRDFDPATDSILVYYEGDAATTSDDGWVRGNLATVAPGVCSDGRPGRILSANLAFGWSGPGVPQLDATGSIENGAPLHGFATVTYRLYRSSDGRWYLGYQEGLDPVQPLIGPLASDGVRFAFFDSGGGVATDPRAVAAIAVTLRAESDQPVRRSDGTLVRVDDEVTTWIALRNNRRY